MSQAIKQQCDFPLCFKGLANKEAELTLRQDEEKYNQALNVVI